MIYSATTNGIEHKFDTNVHNYGSSVLAIGYEDEDEINTNKYSDISDKQESYVTECSVLSSVGKMINADSIMSPEEKVECLQDQINKFCQEWGMNHTIE
jgi:hypothetical protein